MTQTIPQPSAVRSPQGRIGGVVVGRRLQSLVLLPVVIVVAIIGAFVSPHFLTFNNLVGNVLATSAALGLLVIAESMILIAGYFDLSIESTTGFSIMLLVVLTASTGIGLPLWAGLLLTTACVVAIGLFNGFMIAVLKLNPFIVTLAMLILIQGFTLGISNGVTFTNIPDFILFLGSAAPAGIPIQAIIFVVTFAIAALFLRFTATGRSIYAMGGSIDAARAAGIRTRRLTMGLLVFGSVLAMLAGWLLSARTAAATPSLGEGIVFTVFAAAVLGGIDLNGGRGSLVGAALGVVLLGLVQNILTLSSVPTFWINAAYGAIIVGALLVSRVSSIASRGRRLRAAV